MKHTFYSFILGLLVFTSCTQQTNKKIASKYQLHFLDEYLLEDSLFVQNTPVGGLSGIDFFENSYYLVVDDASSPRFLKANITIDENIITDIHFTDVVFLNDSISNFYKENILDLEGVFVDEKNKETYFISEGSINNNKSPSVFKTDTLGNFKTSFEVPPMFYANSVSKPKHNAVFEGATKSIDGRGFWVAMEGPLESDGEHPTFEKTSSPIRVTYFDYKKQKATKQFGYQLENITNPAKGTVNVNGVTAILEYAKNQFFVIERTYQSGYGMDGNIIRIFDVTIDDATTNILDIQSLKATKFIAVKKELLLDLTTIKDKLKFKVVDNIEGITLGPKLANGNQSLILVADNNFQQYGKQLNQFILLEIKTK